MLRKLIVVFAGFTLLLAGCGAPITPTPLQVLPTEPILVPTMVSTTTPTNVPDDLTFTDGLGRIVKLAGTAKKIVSLAPSDTELLFAVGAGSQVIGRDDYSDFPAEVKPLPALGSLDKVNTEQLVALKPDLVLMAEINQREQVKALEDLGLTVYYLSNPKTIEDMYANLQIVASLTGHQQEAAALIEKLKVRVDAVDQKIKAAADKPLVFYELDSTDPAKPYTVGPSTFVDLLISRAGGINLTTAAGITDPYPQVSVEQIVATNPDYIVLGDLMWGITVESVGQRPGWGKLKAVTGNQVYPFDDNIVSRPGPRLVDGLEALAKLIHPELYK